MEAAFKKDVLDLVRSKRLSLLEPVLCVPLAPHCGVVDAPRVHAWGYSCEPSWLQRDDDADGSSSYVISASALVLARAAAEEATSRCERRGEALGYALGDAMSSFVLALRIDRADGAAVLSYLGSVFERGSLLAQQLRNLMKGRGAPRDVDDAVELLATACSAAAGVAPPAICIFELSPTLRLLSRPFKGWALVSDAVVMPLATPRDAAVIMLPLLCAAVGPHVGEAASVDDMQAYKRLAEETGGSNLAAALAYASSWSARDAARVLATSHSASRGLPAPEAAHEALQAQLLKVHEAARDAQAQDAQAQDAQAHEAAPQAVPPQIAVEAAEGSPSRLRRAVPRWVRAARKARKAPKSYKGACAQQQSGAPLAPWARGALRAPLAQRQACTQRQPCAQPARSVGGVECTGKAVERCARHDS